MSTPLHTGLVILVFSSALSPVLHSLLDTVSTDTIYAMTFLFLFLNFACLPYGNGIRGPRADGSMDSNIVSVATGFLASLCMASRLPGPTETLILILSATLVFATWPTIRHRIQVSLDCNLNVRERRPLGSLALNIVVVLSPRPRR